MFFRILVHCLVIFVIIISPEKNQAQMWPFFPFFIKQNSPLQVQEIGGSNYVFWSVGDFQYTWTEEDWRKPGQLKPVIALYHENPDLVRTQLQKMYIQGQRKISVVIWFSVFDESMRDLPVTIHLINASDGQLPIQQKKNLKEFLNVVENIGFDEIHIRFAQQWLSNPEGWNRDYEWYEQNRSFIFSTIDLVQSTIKKMNVLYDLGGELGGLTEGRHRYVKSYMSRLWMEYVHRYGSQNTVGFSFAVAKKRVLNQYRLYQDLGVYPPYISLDIYGKKEVLIDQLDDVFQELEFFDQQQVPWIIQECYYNDIDTISALRNVQALRSVKIKTIMQWPLSREAAEEKGARHITESFPENFSNFLDFVVYDNSN